MRYFIVFYNAIDKDNDTISSFTASAIRDGYINDKSYCKQIAKERDFNKIAITNIIELNKSDFKDFTSND